LMPVQISPLLTCQHFDGLEQSIGFGGNYGWYSRISWKGKHVRLQVQDLHVGPEDSGILSKK
jgi:hypothetical protein